MNKATPYPSCEPEQEIIYLDILPDRDPAPVIKIKRFSNEEITEYELTAW
jgi:hypothetical protein